MQTIETTRYIFSHLRGCKINMKRLQRKEFSIFQQTGGRERGVWITYKRRGFSASVRTRFLYSMQHFYLSFCRYVHVYIAANVCTISHVSSLVYIYGTRAFEIQENISLKIYLYMLLCFSERNFALVFLSLCYLFVLGCFRTIQFYENKDRLYTQTKISY